jgi:hypothetical protein
MIRLSAVAATHFAGALCGALNGTDADTLALLLTGCFTHLKTQLARRCLRHKWTTRLEYAQLQQPTVPRMSHNGTEPEV